MTSGYATLTPSCASSQRLRSTPPAYPVSAPFAPITRWHGTITATGFCPLARPAARTALGDPIAAANWP